MNTLPTSLPSNTMPEDVFALLRVHELRAQFVSPGIPEANQKPHCIIAFETDEPCPEVVNQAFMKIINNLGLVYDDFPSGVRAWDTEPYTWPEDTAIQVLDWEEDPILTKV